MGESLLVRKAGGGLKIEEALQSFTVAPGETITAGTFVDYINDFIATTPVSFSSSNFTNFSESRKAKAVRLNDTKIALIYGSFNGSSTSLIIQLITINNDNTFTFGNPNAFWGTGSVYGMDAQKISDDEILVAGIFYSTPYPMIVGRYKLNEQQTNFVQVTTSSFTTNNENGNPVTSIAVLNENQAVLLWTDNNYIPKVRVINLSNNAISFGTVVENNQFNIGVTYDTGTISKLTDTTAISVQALRTNDTVNSVPNNSYTLGARIMTIQSNNTITFTDTNWFNIEFKRTEDGHGLQNLKSVRVNNNQVVVSYKYRLSSSYNSAQGNGIILFNCVGDKIKSYSKLHFIGGNNTSYQMNSNSIDVFGNKIITAQNYEYESSLTLNQNNTNIQIFKIEDKQIKLDGEFYSFGQTNSFQTTKNLINGQSICFINENKLFFAFNQTNVSPSSRAIIININKKIKNSSGKVFGLAARSGTAGQTIEVYVNKET